MSIVRVPFSLTGGAGGYVIKGSGLFDGGYLYQTPSAGDSNQVFTMEIVGKHTFVPSGADDHLFTAGTDTSNYWDISWTTTGALQIVLVESGGIVDQIITTPLYRDFGAFYQIVIGVDKTAAASDDRYTIEYNGTAITSFSTNTREAAGGDTFVGKANVHVISAFVDLARNAYDYLSRFTYIDGTKLDATSFGELDNNGGWSLLNVSGLTFGTNGWLIEGGTDMAAGLDSRDVSTQITASGAYIGDMTNNGGLAAAFDGITSQASTASAASPSQTTAYCGQDEGAGNSATVTKVKVYGPNNTAPFDSNDRTIELYGSNTSPASDTDGTLIASGIYQGQVSAIGYINAPSNTTAYRYHWVRFVGSGSNAWYAAEVQFYEGDSGGPSWFVEGTITAINDSPTDDAANDYGNRWVTGFDSTYNYGGTLSNRNLTLTHSSDPSRCIVSNALIHAGMIPDAGWEFHVTSITGDNQHSVYLMQSDEDDFFGAGPAAKAVSYDGPSGVVKRNGTTITTANTYGAGDTVEVWIGSDSSGTVKFYKNGSLEATVTSVFANDERYRIGVYMGWNASVHPTMTLGFYDLTPVNSGKEFNTAYLPAPTVTDPSAYFQTLLWTGDTNSPRSITGFTDAAGNNVTPDFVWIKSRSNAVSHYLQDVVRGFGGSKELLPDATSAEGSQGTGNGYIDSVVPGGFSVTDGSTNDVYVNENGYTYVAWCLKAGGSGSSNTDGSITSTVSVAANGGFSIGTYTGTGTAGTVGHGLGSTPGYVWIKRTDTTGNWLVYVDELSGTKRLLLNATDAIATEAVFNDTNATASVFSIGSSTWSDVNASGGTYVFYAFARTNGLIGIGSFEGNASADGSYVVVDDGGSGFAPAFVIIKNIDSGGSWCIFDNARPGYNASTKGLLFPNASSVENNTNNIDFTANGFKCRGTSAAYNQDTLIYLAFAEYPFGGAGISQARAR